MRNSTLSRVFLLVLSVSLLAACSPQSEQQPLDREAVLQSQIKNLKTPAANTLSSGQPTEEQLRILAQAGVKHIVNLRTASEQDWDEAAFVKSLGMEYHSIPVARTGGITSANAQSLSQLLERIDQPALVHCGSGNRVGALMAVSAAQSRGLDIDAAVAEGQRWGLTGLESTVREVLAAD